MKDVILLKANFDDEKLWGGTRLYSFGYDGNSQKIGEAYLISGLEDKPSFILDDDVKQKDLYHFYKENKSWFNNYNGEYPLLSKIIDANDDLSVQVHPNNDYAKKKFNKNGKTECWYILDCAKDADIIFGINTNNKKDIEQAIEDNIWSDVLKTEKITPGDVLYIPSGTVHAIKKNTFLFEIQQSSDLTFRLYDYDRIDNDGNKRPLHIEDSLNCIDYNIKNEKTRVINDVLIDSEYFKTEIHNIQGFKSFLYKNVYWVEVVVLEGYGNINGLKIKKGISALVKEGVIFNIEGTLKIAITYIKK